MTLMRVDLNIEDLFGRIQCGRRGVLIGFHESRMADSVGSQYRRKPLSDCAFARYAGPPLGTPAMVRHEMKGLHLRDRAGFDTRYSGQHASRCGG
ncbi:MAG TPA: hypothetical protein VGK44_19405 [Casimicrobiaceae bacterium]|jgi:hypothetical protein